MELTPRRLTRITVAAVVAALVLAIVVVAQLILLGGPSRDVTREGDTLTTEVTSVSSSGRSLCVVRDGSDDTCGFPVVLPRSEGRLVAGESVTVTELWVTQGDITSLTWLVR